MIKFREHRVSLKKSMETLKEFNSEGELLQYVYDLWYDKEKVRIESILFQYVGKDERIDWETYNVVVYYGYYNIQGSYEHSQLVAGQATGIVSVKDEDSITINDFEKRLEELSISIKKGGYSLPVLYKLIDAFQNPLYLHVREQLFDCIYHSIYSIG